jgi:hypothetical protein
MDRRNSSTSLDLKCKCALNPFASRRGTIFLYSWILKAMSEIESHFNLSDI